MELELTPAGLLTSGLDGGWIRKAARDSRVTPERDERADGRIERAAGRPRNLDRAPEHGHQLGADANGVAGPVEGTQLAVGPVVAHHAVELGDARERVARGGFG